MKPSMAWTATKASHTSSAFVTRPAGNWSASVRSIARTIGKENASNLAWDRAQPGAKRSRFGRPLSTRHGRSWEPHDSPYWQPHSGWPERDSGLTTLRGHVIKLALRL